MGFSKAFGAEFFYRVALPGLLLAVLVQPLVSHLPAALGLGAYFPTEPMTVLATIALVGGLILAGATRSVYYLFEGFTGAKVWRRLGFTWQVRRKNKLSARQLELVDKGKERSRREEDEVSVVAGRLRDYPVELDPKSGGSVYVADRPTLIGNIIASYELYPRSRYGIDGEAFWHHFRMLAPDGTAKEMDAAEAVADGMILTSFAAAVGACVNGIALALVTLGQWYAWLPSAPVTLRQTLLLSIGGVLGFVTFLQLGKASHREYGRVVRAMVDLTYPEVIERLTIGFPTQAQRDALQQRRERLETLAGVTAPEVATEGRKRELTNPEAAPGSL